MARQKYQNPPAQKERNSFAKYLSEDEELIIAAGYSPTYLRQRFILHLLIPGALFILLGLGAAYFLKQNLGYGLGVGFLMAAISSYLQTLITYHAHRYLLTTRRVIIKIGFFNVKLISALFDKITHIELDQGIIDRIIMHHGRIIVHTAGMSKDEIVLNFVEAPVEFKNLLERLINRQREGLGRQIGSITTVEGELVE